MTAFEILGILKLDKSDFDRGLDSAKKAGSALGSGAHALMGGVATAAKVGLAAVGAATTAAVGFGKSAVDAAVSYESAFTGVRKTVDATEEEYAQLSDWIKQASTEMASSQEVIAGTMEIAGQLGIRGVDGLETFTKTMIMLGDTTNLNAEEAASALAKFGNIAGLQATDMDKIGSVIVDLGNHFATTEADIVAMSTRLASAGTIAGFSATDILALSTAMSSVGLNAEAGGTAMSTIMTKIGRAVDSGGDKLDLFASTAGMTSEEFVATWKSAPTEALQGFVKGLDNMIDSGGNVTAVLDDLAIKGIRETNTIKSLALASDVLTGAVDMANNAFEENVALANEANLRYGTTESQMIQMQNSFKNLRIAIGEELQPMYGELMSFSTGAIQAMQKGFEEGGLDGLMSSFGTALSDGLNMLNEKLPTLVEAGVSLVSALGQGIMDNLDTIIDAGVQVIGTLGEAFVSGFPAIIDAGLQILEALLSAFDENFDVIMDAVQKLITGIGEAVENHKDGLRDTALSILEKLTNFLIENLDEIARFVSEMLVKFVKWVGDNAGSIIKSAVEIITTLADGLVDSLPELLPAIVETIVAIVEGLIDNVDKLIDSALEIIIALAEGLIDSLPKLIEKAPIIVQKLVDAIIEAAPKLLDAAVEIIGKLAEYIIEHLPEMAKAGNDILAAIGEGIIELLLSVPKWGNDIMDKIKEGIDEIDVPEWGRDLIRGFVDGMTGGEAMRWLREGAETVAEKIKDFLGFSEPEEGPLSNFHTFAPDMMELYASGIRDNMDLVEDAVLGTADAINSGFDITAEPTYRVGVATANAGTEQRLNEILDILESYMPTYATAQDMESMSINVDNRSFGRLVREVV